MSMMPGACKDHSWEMNVTPLIDVLLVLLIIFMVLPHQLGENTEIPRPDGDPIAQPDPEPVIVIRLNDAGAGRPPTVRVNRTEVGWDELAPTLRNACEKRRDKAVFLQGDAEIDFQYVAEAVDVAHRAGADRVGLLDAKE